MDFEVGNIPVFLGLCAFCLIVIWKSPGYLMAHRIIISIGVVPMVYLIMNKMAN